VVFCGRVLVRIPDKCQHAFGAGQRGRLVPAPVEHGAGQSRKRAQVPVDQLDDREAVRILETLPKRRANVTGSFQVVVVHDERVQQRVRQPDRHDAPVERISVSCGYETRLKLLISNVKLYNILLILLYFVG